MSSAGKIRDLDAAVAWRSIAPAPVVLTNGVFDLLHAGHVHLLEEARKQGASLVVAVNSDDSAKRLNKGSGRPIVSQRDRATVLAAFSAVDCVVIFDEPTPERVIAALTPDVLVKGGDYRPDSVAGADLVRARGGRVVIVPLLPHQSTSRMVEKIRDST